MLGRAGAGAPAKFGSAPVYTHLLRQVRELRQRKQAWRRRWLRWEAAQEVEEGVWRSHSQPGP
jgi:hypothetical protein